MPSPKLPIGMRSSANDDPLAEARRRAEQAVLKIARLIGRQMAREEFAKRPTQAACDDSEQL